MSLLRIGGTSSHRCPPPVEEPGHVLSDIRRHDALKVACIAFSDAGAHKGKAGVTSLSGPAFPLETVTYALLLARFSPGVAEANLDGSGALDTGTAVDILRPQGRTSKGADRRR